MHFLHTRRGQINYAQLRQPWRGHGLWFIVAGFTAKHREAEKSPRKVPLHGAAARRDSNRGIGTRAERNEHHARDLRMLELFMDRRIAIEFRSWYFIVTS